MDKIRPGAVLFLYNRDTKAIVGPFTAAVEGATQIEIGTWVMGVNEHEFSENITVQWEGLHVIENADQRYDFLRSRHKYELSQLQIQTLLDDLRDAPTYEG